MNPFQYIASINNTKKDLMVDDAAENNAEGEERPELNPLGNAAGHNRTGSAAEDHLEEPVRGRRVTGRVVTGQSSSIVSGPETERSNIATINTGVHQVIAA